MSIIVGKTTVHVIADVLCWRSGLAVDADGSPRCYGPDDTGLDYTANAGKPGHWYGVVTNKFKEPIPQGKHDPYPGLWVSTTALVDKRYSLRDPLRYVNSETIPYIVIPKDLRDLSAKLGEVAIVYNAKNKEMSAAIVADIGPRGKIGEGSIALCDALGIPSSPRTGGTKNNILTVLFLGTSRGWPREINDFGAQAEALFSDWGGPDTLLRVLPSPV